MKKLIAIALLVLMTIGTYSQTAVTKGTSVARWGSYLYVPTTSSRFNTTVPPGTLIGCGGDTNYSYVTKGYTWGQGGTLALVLADTKYYVKNLKVGTGSLATLAVSSTSAFTGAVTMASTLGVTGNVAVNTNKFAVTASSGNTAIAGTLAVTGASTLTGAVGITGATTVTGGLIGTSATRGSSTFTTTATRKAVYIAGAADTDVYIVRGVAADSHTRPVAGDLLNCFAVADSLIVMRAAGTTSGQGFSYFRIK